MELGKKVSVLKREKEGKNILLRKCQTLHEEINSLKEERQK